MSIWACKAIWARTLDILRFIINYKVIYNFASLINHDFGKAIQNIDSNVKIF
jgi:hypothetical protein